MYARTIVLTLTISLLMGCPKSGEEAGDGPGTTVVDGLEMSGIIVSVADDGEGFNLWDPRTDTSSALEYPLYFSGNDLPIDVSPNGKLAAYLNPSGAVIVARFIDDAGLPSLELVTAFEDLDMSESRFLRFNAHGDRLWNNRYWIDFESGSIDTCAFPDDLEPTPDGYHYFCGSSFMRDGFELASSLDPRFWGVSNADPEPSEAPVFNLRNISADGQLAGHASLHPLTLLLDSTMEDVAIELPYPGPDGQQWGADHGRHGTIVRREAGTGQGGTQDVCIRKEVDRMPVESAVLDRGAKVMERSEALRARPWDLKPLAEFNDRDDSRLFRPLGRNLETNELVYNVAYRYIDDLSCTNTESEQRLVAIAPDGTMRTFVDRDEFGDSKLLATPDIRPWLSRDPWFQFNLAVLDGGDMLVSRASGVVVREFLGWLDGEPVSLEGSSVDNRGEGLLSYQYLEDEEAFAVCHRRFAGGQVCAKRTMGGGRPLFVAAEGVMAGDVVRRPILRELSRSAGPPGETVILFGVGFGSEGKVMLGDFEVPSADVSSWSDDRIELTISEGWPQVGDIRVENISGSSSGPNHIRRYFARTTSVSTPLDSIPDFIERYQGLNLHNFDLPPGVRLQGRSPDAEGNYVYLSEGVDESSYNPTAFHTDAFVRIATVVTHPGMVESSAWTPIGDTVLTDGGFAWLAGELVETGQSVRPRMTERVILDEVARTPPGASMPTGIPQSFRTNDLGAFTMGTAVYSGRPVLIDGWDFEAGELRPVVRRDLGLLGGATDFGFVGDLAVATGAYPNGNAVDSGYQVSISGGIGWNAVEPSNAMLFWPIGVVTPTGPAIVAAAEEPDTLERTFRRIDANGITTIDVELEGGGTPAALSRESRHYTAGPSAIVHLPGEQPLHLDTTSTPYRFAPLDVPAAVVSLVHDLPSSSILVVLSDGTVHEASFDAAGLGEFVDLNIDVVLSDGTRVTPRHITRFQDDRWLVQGTLGDEVEWTDRSAVWAISPPR